MDADKDIPECPGCRRRDAIIADLLKRVAALEARLNANSSNSSIPPSANPLQAPPPVVKKKSKRKRGGQPGHPPHLKMLLPSERVTQIKPIIPTRCRACDEPLPREASAGDPEPKRFQVVEIQPTPVDVVEYQAHGRTCRCCGTVTQAVVPAEIRRHSIGPRLTATLSYLTGCHGISKRGIEDIVETVFQVPIALGTVSKLEQEVAAALEPAHTEAVEAVRQAEVKFADETGWYLWGKLCWLWGAATKDVVAFLIHAKRGVVGLQALLGDKIHGYLHSDRWHVYSHVAAECRQLCWAHLKRDFQKIVDGGGPSAFVGRRGLRIVRELFVAWHAFQAGTINLARLRALIEPLESRLEKTLLKGAFGDDPTVAKFCENLIVLDPALWTFSKVDGVEPTNNHMERLVRLAVLWRRRSFGCNSDAGCRFVERILTAVQTCRLQNRNALEFLTATLDAHRASKPAPRMLMG